MFCIVHVSVQIVIGFKRISFDLININFVLFLSLEDDKDFVYGSVPQSIIDDQEDILRNIHQHSSDLVCDLMLLFAVVVNAAAIIAIVVVIAAVFQVYFIIIFLGF